IRNGTAATVSDELDNPAPTAAKAFPGQQVLPPGTTVRTLNLDVCASSPTRSERAADAAVRLMAFLLLLVPIGLGWRMVRAARAHGVFSAAVARALTVLGAWVLIGTAVFSIAITLVENWLLDRLLPGGAGQPVHVPWSWGALLTAFGMLALGR